MLSWLARVSIGPAATHSEQSAHKFPDNRASTQILFGRQHAQLFTLVLT